MRVITKTYSDKIVYWEIDAADGFGGYSFKAPIQLIGRWEQAIDEELKSLKGDNPKEVVLANHKVYTTLQLQLGGYLFLGDIADIDLQKSPIEIKDAWKILERKIIRGIRGKGTIISNLL